MIGRQEDAVDGGSVFPTGQVVGKTDSDLRVVRRYVLERRLAPFYVGKGDAVSASDVECPICFLVSRAAGGPGGGRLQLHAANRRARACC